MRFRVPATAMALSFDTPGVLDAAGRFCPAVPDGRGGWTPLTTGVPAVEGEPTPSFAVYRVQQLPDAERHDPPGFQVERVE